jgi:threonine aldolase
MVFFTLPESVITESALIEGLLKKNIKISGTENGEYRFVTNHGVNSDDIDWVIESMKTLVSHYS